MQSRTFIASCIIAALLASPAIAGSDLTVKVEGLRNAKGAVWVCLWKREQTDFPKCVNGKTAFARLKAPTGAPLVKFEDVAPGTYAVTAVHDETGTGNGEFNALGMPLSGVGLSNTPELGVMNRPTFDKGAFDMPKTTALTIKLNYLF